MRQETVDAAVRDYLAGDYDGQSVTVIAHDGESSQVFLGLYEWDTSTSTHQRNAEVEFFEAINTSPRVDVSWDHDSWHHFKLVAYTPKN